MERFEREKKTLQAMIALYCRDLHKAGDGLCADCVSLQEYALTRLERCTFGPDKPKCADCPIHCYKPAMRNAIRDVMRYSGPRMLVRHPILALGHTIDGVLHRPDKSKAKSRPPAAAGQADSKLLLELQRGLPLVPHPFARLGEGAGLTESAVLSRVRELLDQGVARRFGAVFDSASLGYQGALCAVDVPEAGLERMAAALNPHPGVTHCYQREGHPNLWFTLTAPADTHARELARLSAALAPHEVLCFPALRVFKIEAVFDGSKGGEAASAVARGAPRARTSPPVALSERERDVVRRMQGMLPLSEDPFLSLARELNWEHAELLALLARWKESGVLRRVGLIVRHQRVGFEANSMCVWPVAADRIEAAGKILAASNRVSHCYERPASAVFPFNLYAMVHAHTREELTGIFGKLSSAAGLTGGRMLWSVREFKKSSPLFFPEPGQEQGLP